jgi:UDP:flavonoid glycosyltransferase YjiC (YdhE family)
LQPAEDDLAAWESADLLLVTAPKWFDLAGDFPSNVVHAGPLGVTRPTHVAGTPERRPLVLLSFSTTVMQGQVALIQRVCDAIAAEEADAILTLGPAVSARVIRLPGNVEALPYADHDWLLPRCAAIVSHGGLGTRRRSFWNSVEQVTSTNGRLSSSSHTGGSAGGSQRPGPTSRTLAGQSERGYSNGSAV